MNWELRGSYKKIQNNQKPRTKLSDEQIQRLNDAGFKWSLNSDFDDHFNDHERSQFSQFVSFSILLKYMPENSPKIQHSRRSAGIFEFQNQHKKRWQWILDSWPQSSTRCWCCTKENSHQPSPITHRSDNYRLQYHTFSWYCIVLSRANREQPNKLNWTELNWHHIRHQAKPL